MLKSSAILGLAVCSCLSPAVAWGAESPRGRALLAAAFLAEGAEAQLTQASQLRFDSWLAQLRADETVTGDVRACAAAIFTRLHHDLLHGRYVASVTAVSGALETGDYNCVSATILFQAAADEFGLTVHAVESARHVFSRVMTELDSFDVETTFPAWFNSSDAKRLHAARLANSCREITNRQLIAAIYYNRAVDLLNQGQFAGAIAANEACLRLDGDHSAAAANLLAAYNNWALALGRAGQYRAALDVLAEGRRIDATHEPFAANEVYLRGAWVKLGE